MNQAATPILIITGISFANEFMDHGLDVTEVKILLGGGIAYLLTSAISGIPGAGPVIGLLAWVALAGYAVVPAGPGQQAPVPKLLSRFGG